jgi:hypothetical protein
MDEFIGTYANGVVIPDAPLPIPDDSRVELVVAGVPVDSRSLQDRQLAVRKFLALATAFPLKGPVIRFSRDELHERR